MSIRPTEILDLLPATTADLSTALGVTESTVRDHISTLRARGYEIGTDSDGRRMLISETVPDHPTNMTRSYEQSPGEITRRANDHLSEMKRRLNTLLAESKPPVADGGIDPLPDAEDVVIFRTDSHFGDIEHDEFGRVIYNAEIAEARERYITDEVMSLIDRQEAAGSVFDTAHLLLGGDIVTGEGIYEGQPWDTELTLDKQIDLAVEVFFAQIRRLAARFPRVQVVCVPGNHGEIRVKSPSGGANADLFVYGFLDMLVRNSDLDNVTFIRNESTSFVNFSMRDDRWRGHLRHGQDSLSHVGTASSLNRWGAWHRSNQFDIGYRGHYHEFKVEPMDGIPIIEGGSIAPPGDYAEGLGYGGSRPGAVIHGVSDSRPLSWLYPVDFIGAPGAAGGNIDSPPDGGSTDGPAVGGVSA